MRFFERIAQDWNIRLCALRDQFGVGLHQADAIFRTAGFRICGPHCQREIRKDICILVQRFVADAFEIGLRIQEEIPERNGAVAPNRLREFVVGVVLVREVLEILPDARVELNSLLPLLLLDARG